MPTAYSIVNSAARLLNVISGNTLPNSEAQDALTALNEMLGLWSLQKLLIYHYQEVVGTLQSGHNPHTIGAAGDIVVAERPVRIENAFTRSAGTDYPMTAIGGDSYAIIREKSSESLYPSFFFYDTAYSTGSLYVYPLAVADLEVHLMARVRLTEFATLATDLDLPPGYDAALKYQLAVDIAPFYGVPESVVSPIRAKAAEMRRWIKSSNMQPSDVATDLHRFGRPPLFDINRGW